MLNHYFTVWMCHNYVAKGNILKELLMTDTEQSFKKTGNKSVNT